MAYTRIQTSGRSAAKAEVQPSGPETIEEENQKKRHDDLVEESSSVIKDADELLAKIDADPSLLGGLAVSTF